MDDWVSLEKMDLTSVELPETMLDANGKWVPTSLQFPYNKDLAKYLADAWSLYT